MGCYQFLIFLLVISINLIWSSQCYDFYVGGKDGWVLTPSENFNHWAERNRFQVNHSLVFRYKKEEDSVSVVKKEDYDKCNIKNPISRFNDGYSVFKFDQSGPFYFISGSPGNCEKGQKLIVVVLAVRDKRPPNIPPISPSPVPSSSTLSPSPSPSTPPSSSSGAETAPAPSPPNSSASPPFFSFISSGVVFLGVVMAMVFASFVGLF